MDHVDTPYIKKKDKSTSEERDLRDHGFVRDGHHVQIVEPQDTV